MEAPGSKTEAPRSLISEFFTGEALAKLLVYLCNTRAPEAWDPVTATTLDVLTGRLQLCLTSTGLVPFKGKAALVYPYHMMSASQKDYLREALEDRTAFCVCNDALVFHAHGGDFHAHGGDRLDPVPVLRALCDSVLASKIHEEQRVRVGVCNILLQRVQSVVPISRGAQQELNALLFG